VKDVFKVKLKEILEEEGGQTKGDKRGIWG
jgi:hypothetical protein